QMPAQASRFCTPCRKTKAFDKKKKHKIKRAFIKTWPYSPALKTLGKQKGKALWALPFLSILPLTAETNIF
ncbi:MAG TPA: hypothetical protein VK927_07210, partial [Adhaeribacter sp.]|nr:hypothetical protein [Adhaeribacter sp.]